MSDAPEPLRDGRDDPRMAGQHVCRSTPSETRSHESDGEIVVVDGSGKPAPEPDDVGPDVVWISRPGESVFQMRPVGYAACRGEIVAVTEDHCAPAPDWLDRILAAHVEHPEAIAIGGVVENGTTDHLVDWATFIVTQGPFIGPIPNGPADADRRGRHRQLQARGARTAARSMGRSVRSSSSTPPRCGVPARRSSTTTRSG